MELIFADLNFKKTIIEEQVSIDAILICWCKHLSLKVGEKFQTFIKEFPDVCYFC